MKSFLVVLALGVGFAPAALAATDDVGGVRTSGLAIATASVLVGGRQVALLGPAGGYTPQQRAQLMRQALERAVTPAVLPALTPWDVDVVVIRGAPVVTLRGNRLVTVTAIDARLAGQEPGVVAATWARELRAGVDALRVGGGTTEGFVAIVPGTAVFHGGGAGAGGGPWGR